MAQEDRFELTKGGNLEPAAQLLRMANIFYRHAFWIYWPLYRCYKLVHDRRRIDWLRVRLKRGMTALDIGANVGFYSYMMARMVGGEGRVHAFEPDPDNFRRLQTVTCRFANVIICKAAVAATSGTLQLYRSPHLNVDHRCFDSADGRLPIKIRALAIDDYFTDNETVDCVKIDIQGFEPVALRGMQDTIERSPRVFLLSEIWPWGLQKAGSSVDEYANLLRRMGFHSLDLDVQNVRLLEEKACTAAFYTEIVAVKGCGDP